ncbi:hypothetical protein Hanom_Chr13g01204311 [Helianthus anomalus]
MALSSSSNMTTPIHDNYLSDVDYVNSIKKFDVDDLFLMIVLSSLIVTK